MPNKNGSSATQRVVSSHVSHCQSGLHVCLEIRGPPKVVGFGFPCSKAKKFSPGLAKQPDSLCPGVWEAQFISSLGAQLAPWARVSTVLPPLEGPRINPRTGLLFRPGLLGIERDQISGLEIKQPTEMSDSVASICWCPFLQTSPQQA